MQIVRMQSDSSFAHGRAAETMSVNFLLEQSPLNRARLVLGSCQMQP